MVERPKLPPDDPHSEESEMRRAERQSKILSGEIPDQIDQAIKHIAGAKVE